MANIIIGGIALVGAGAVAYAWQRRGPTRDEGPISLLVALIARTLMGVLVGGLVGLLLTSFFQPAALAHMSVPNFWPLIHMIAGSIGGLLGAHIGGLMAGEQRRGL